MNVEQLAVAAKRAAELWPGAEIVRNQVGNVSVVRDGEYVGYIDFGVFPGDDPVGVVAE